jgi:pyruvate dehydrogenase E1 component beta subunit
MTTTQEPIAAPTHGTHRLTTAKAIAEGIAEEMRRDPSVVYLGEDVGAYGGIFGATTGLLEEFGPTRIIDTPISETAFIGLGTGAAVEGMRPIVEVMFSDFVGVCLDQIYNHMAKIHYESGGNVSVPMVVTMAAGGGYSDAAQHSQCLWGTLAHLPGMKVVAPSNPYDAKGLMVSAIRDDGPVVYVFHKGVMGLAWMARNDRAVADVPEDAYTVPIGEAAVAREGTDVTVVTISRSVHHALDVAQKLADEASVEVLDLRSLVPLDRTAILASVAKTGRLVVVDEDYQSFGMSGEVVATVTDVDPRLLHAPALRVANPDTPIPYSRPLEQAILPMPDRIEAAIRRVLAA